MARGTWRTVGSPHPCSNPCPTNDSPRATAGGIPAGALLVSERPMVAVLSDAALGGSPGERGHGQTGTRCHTCEATSTLFWTTSHVVQGPVEPPHTRRVTYSSSSPCLLDVVPINYYFLIGACHPIICSICVARLRGAPAVVRRLRGLPVCRVLPRSMPPGRRPRQVGPPRCSWLGLDFDCL